MLNFALSPLLLVECVRCGHTLCIHIEQTKKNGVHCPNGRTLFIYCYMLQPQPLAQKHIYFARPYSHDYIMIPKLLLLYLYAVHASWSEAARVSESESVWQLRIAGAGSTQQRISVTMALAQGWMDRCSRTLPHMPIKGCSQHPALRA